MVQKKYDCISFKWRKRNIKKGKKQQRYILHQCVIHGRNNCLFKPHWFEIQSNTCKILHTQMVCHFFCSPWKTLTHVHTSAQKKTCVLLYISNSIELHFFLTSFQSHGECNKCERFFYTCTVYTHFYDTKKHNT